jgi:hypothetical protein
MQTLHEFVNSSGRTVVILHAEVEITGLVSTGIQVDFPAGWLVAD